jgi:hypothetical protein
LEEFKGHSYPDVLLSILIKTFVEFKRWLDTAAINPATKKTFWIKIFGAAPKKSSFNRRQTKQLSDGFSQIIAELNGVLLGPDRVGKSETLREKSKTGLTTALSAQVGLKLISADGSANKKREDEIEVESRSEYASEKIEILHRNIMRYKLLFSGLTQLCDGPAYLLLDDLYHIKLSDQANVLDYFHRIAKGENLWIKVGTIRHRSRWYLYGDPPLGMKLGDDAEEIDLDVTLEKYDLTKAFLLRILEQFARETALKADQFLTDGARDRLVLASGGVARDFLTIFRRAIDVARERLARGDDSRGEKIGAEDINKAAGEYDKFKREDFSRDTGREEQEILLTMFEKVSEFCLNKAEANCFLVDKDLLDNNVELVSELVDLKFLHHVRSRVTVRDRVNRVYDAYMLDLSQYAGERARRNFEIVEFWGKNADDSLRKGRLIYLERPR